MKLKNFSPRPFPKERDSETGLYYYGARYYDPKVSLWLSVDPLAEKTMTPYQYCNQSPVMLVDPTGMEGEDPLGPPSKYNKGEVKQGDKMQDLNTGITWTAKEVKEAGMFSSGSITWTAKIPNGTYQEMNDDLIENGTLTEVSIKSISSTSSIRSGLATAFNNSKFGVPQGNAKSEFLYIFTNGPGRPTSNDLGFYRAGDTIIPLNFDDFIGGPSNGGKGWEYKGEALKNLFEKIDGALDQAGIYDTHILPKQRKDTIVPIPTPTGYFYPLYKDELYKVDKDSFESEKTKWENNPYLPTQYNPATYPGKKTNIKNQ